MSNDVKQLRKSKYNRVINGVCGGIGEYLGVDPVLVRAGFIIGSFFTSGGLLLGYIALAFVMPKAQGDSYFAEWRKPHAHSKAKTVEIPVDGKRKNDADPLHYARPIGDIDDMREKAKRIEE